MGIFITFGFFNNTVKNHAEYCIIWSSGIGKRNAVRKIIAKYKLVHISTGDLLREEVAAQTELGMMAKEIMDKGELVSDEIVIGMIRNKLEENQEGPGFIF